MQGHSYVAYSTSNVAHRRDEASSFLSPLCYFPCKPYRIRAHNPIKNFVLYVYLQCWYCTFCYCISTPVSGSSSTFSSMQAMRCHSGEQPDKKCICLAFYHTDNTRFCRCLESDGHISDVKGNLTHPTDNSIS